MDRCVRWFIDGDPGTVVDLGAMDVNGSYRCLFPTGTRYIGVDLEPGPGVDVVLENVYQLPFEDSSIDLVITGQMLEHCGQFWRVFSEIARVLKPGGLAFVIAPSSGPVHRYPVDCYRFYPDSYQALAEWSQLRLVQSWTDERGPWRDIVGIFQKGGTVESVTTAPSQRVFINERQEPSLDLEAEVQSGARPYREVLRELHAILKPERYLEIGVRKGASLALAQCASIAIDPDPHPDLEHAENVRFYRCTSDDFFFFHAAEAVDSPIDLAFIDGMHLAEYVYRDFINVERVMSKSGVIVIDDVFPNHPLQGSRERNSKVWSGDVWRFVELLQQKRPDLKLTWLDTAPTGLLMISNLAPTSRTLWDEYNGLIRKLTDPAGADVPAHVLARKRAVAPTTEALRSSLAR